MVNKDLIRKLSELESKEIDFINKLRIIKIKKNIVAKMLKMHKMSRVRPLTAVS